MTSQVTEFLQAPPRQWPRAAIFDCDGLLIDTAHCWTEALDRTLGRRAPTLNGASVRSASAHLGVDADLLRTELHASFERADLKLLPGAAALVERLSARMPLAVATNGPESVVRAALARMGLLDAFAAVVSAESQPADKPAPHVYLAACLAVTTHPSDAIAFEDSPIGAESARRAGLTVVVVPSNPADRLVGDLRAPRLDDDQILGLLRLDEAPPKKNGAATLDQ